MPLNNGYGVVIGKVDRHFIECPDSEGRWPHYHINVDTPDGLCECVINLKSRTQIKIEYKDYQNVDRQFFSKIISKPDGFHRLVNDLTSGAFDFIRHPGINNIGEWKPESGNNVILQMQSYLNNVKRIYIFGEPYVTGLGLHNVHMNQGDPIGSDFSQENGIWQDGGVLLEYECPEPSFSIFLTKFETQSLNTDEQGRPR